MAQHFTEVKVESITPKAVLLKDGTGTANDGKVKTFACGKFAATSRPVKESKYNISAKDSKNNHISFTGTCSYSGETSEFQRS